VPKEHAPQLADYWALADFRYQVRRFLHRRETAARAAGISAQQYQLLLELKAIEGRSQATIGALAERLHVRHHSAVGLIDRLASRGLVRRRRVAGDRRRVLVEMRPSGEAKLRELALYSLTELRKEGPELVGVLARLTRSGRRFRARQGRLERAEARRR
jgi:DNA-binding MarR family transcriptional regulator